MFLKKSALIILLHIAVVLLAGNQEMIYVDGGTFMMGDVWRDGLSDETMHKVTLSSFYVSKYEITYEQYIKFLNDRKIKKNFNFNGRKLLNNRSDYCAIKYRDSCFSFKANYYANSKNCPIMEVTWYGALSFCNWKSEQEGLTPCYTITNKKVECNWNADGYRLPTEAEWEYAARGGDRKDHKWSGTENMNEIGDYAWYLLNSKLRTHEAGTKKPNHLGIHDMSGNVWEWCWDWYGKLPTSRVTNPREPEKGEKRILRGGGWRSKPYFFRNSYRRYPYYPFKTNSDIGFRIIRSE